MTRVVLAWAVFAASGHQNSEWAETRFDRVHLLNGNFIDGQLIRQTPAGVLLKVKDGEMTIRTDLIKRNGKGEYLVEVIKLRSINEKPRIAPKPPKPGDEPVRVLVPAEPPDAPRNGKTEHPRPARVTPPSVPAEVARQIEGILDVFRVMPKEQHHHLYKEFPPLGDEGQVYLAANLESFDDSTLTFAANVLGFLKRGSAIPLLKKYLESERPAVRAESAKALGGIGEPATARALLPLLKDPVPGVRGAAVLALQQIGDRDSLEPISELCLDPEEPVRQKAGTAVLEIGRKQSMKPATVQAFASALRKAREAAVKGEIIAALGRTQEPEAGVILLTYLLDSDPPIRSATAVALASIGGEKASEAIYQRLTQEQDLWTRVQLAVAARKLNLRKAVGPLIEWLSDPNQYIRQVAQDGLREITRENFGSEQAKWNAWWQENRPRE